MSKRLGLICLTICSLTPFTRAADDVLPVGDAKPALEWSHFPSRLHTFVWRNWESVDLDKMAAVLGTSVENVQAVGESMGLPPHQPITDIQKQRGYIALIRRNWHLVPYEQLLQLLDWDAEQLAYTLKEDDFLWVKLGHAKPQCEPLRYEAPSEEMLARCAEIKRIAKSEFAGKLHVPGEPRFAFVERLSTPLPDAKLPEVNDDDPIRFLYSYFAVYGEPLLDPSLDPYPDGLLQRLAAVGVNGVWLHTVLRDLVPSEDFPDFGHQHEKRLENMAKMVQRAKKYGIRIYLYMNEPRSMPTAWFKDHPEIAGVSEGPATAMCSSTPVVQKYLREGLEYLFKQVPDLGGVFTISMSENLTNCYSRASKDVCPRCSKRKPAEVVAEVNRLITEGVHAGNPDARVIVWDWGWRNEWTEEAIKLLPDNVYYMCVSEWDLPINRGGVDAQIGEYSISAVGPGPRALRHWKWAQDRGFKTLAKVQMNCTWELSTIPYLPTLDLVAEHLLNLQKEGVNDLMLSWSLGGHPSPNLELVQLVNDNPGADIDLILTKLAVKWYGPTAAADARAAWREFSKAFAAFPFHGTVVYAGPMQVGPANPLYPEPSGYPASMVGIPFDAVDQWRSIYPRDAYVDQFRKIVEGWREGLKQLAPATQRTMQTEHRDNLNTALRLAEAAYCHLRSTWNQARFTVARNEIAEGTGDAAEHRKTMRAAAEDEIRLAKQLYELTKKDARIGYEATNHHYYYPLDLVEKVINCRYILSQEN